MKVRELIERLQRENPEAGTLTDRIRKIEITEVREAVVLKRAEPEEEA